MLKAGAAVVDVGLVAAVTAADGDERVPLATPNRALAASTGVAVATLLGVVATTPPTLLLEGVPNAAAGGPVVVVVEDGVPKVVPAGGPRGVATATGVVPCDGKFIPLLALMLLLFMLLPTLILLSPPLFGADEGRLLILLPVWGEGAVSKPANGSAGS